MAINATVPSKKEYKLVPAGNHIARVYRIIHIGTIEDEYMGKPKVFEKVRIGFELPTEKEVFREGEEAKPFVIDAEYTLSMFEKANLRKLVEGILGVGFLDQDAETFDVLDLNGRPCMLNIVHKTVGDKTYANIASAAPLPKGIEAPSQVNPSFILDYGANWDEEKFGGLPQFIREKMQSSAEFKKKFGITEVEYPTEELGASPF